MATQNKPNKSDSIDTSEVMNVPAMEKQIDNTITKADLELIKSNREIAQASARKKELIRNYKNENKVITYLSPMYRPYFGNVMTVTMNGISIRFPVDGTKHEIPATFADEIERRRLHIDNVINRQVKMAAVRENEDKAGAIGSLNLF